MRKEIIKLFDIVAGSLDIKRATIYMSPKFIIRLTQQRKVSCRDKSETMLLTIGRPNYAEREFIKKCIKAKEPFPIKKAQLTWRRP